MGKVVGAVAALGVLLGVACGGGGVGLEEEGRINPPPGARMHVGYEPGGSLGTRDGSMTPRRDGGTDDGGVDGGTDGGS